MATIPKQLQTENIRFCFVDCKIPMGKEWQQKENTYAYNDSKLLKRIKEGKNYGVVGGYGDIMIVDADVPKIVTAFAVFPDTLTIKTGNGTHLYYFVPGLQKSTALQEETEDSTPDNLQFKNIGHITSKGRMVVGPGGKHYQQLDDGKFKATGKYYEVIKDLPIRTITNEQLQTAINPFLSEKIREQKPQQEDMKKNDETSIINFPISLVADKMNDLVKAPPGYRGHNPDHPKSKSRKDLAINTEENRFVCGACADSGYGFGSSLYLIALNEGILHCHECKKGGLRGEKFLQVKKLAIEKYGVDPKVFGTITKNAGITISGDIPTQKNTEEELNEGVYIDDDSFVGKYTKYQYLRTNAPRNYGTHLGVQLIGMMMGYDTVNLIQPSEIHHNTYMLFIGPSGKSKKTTAQNILKQITPQNRWHPDVFSPEGFLASLTDKPDGVAFLGEFSSLLHGVSNGGYMSHMKELMNELYGCPEIYYKKLANSKKCFTVEKPYLNANSTCTEDGLIPYLNHELVHGGFLARYNMVAGLGHYRKRGPIPDEARKQENEFRSAIFNLQRLFKTEKVVFLLTDAAFDALDVIFRDLEENHYWDGVSPFVARCQDNIVKYADILAMSDILGRASLTSLASLSSLTSEMREIREINKNVKNPLYGENIISLVNNDNDDNDVNDVNDVNHAHKIVINVGPGYIAKAWKILKPCLEYTRKFVQYIDEDQPVAKVFDIIKKYGPIKRSFLMQRSHLKNTDFKEAIETLKEREEIFHVAVKTKAHGRDYLHSVFCHTGIGEDRCKNCVYKCETKDRMPFIELLYEKEQKQETCMTAPSESEELVASPEVKIVYDEPAQVTIKREIEPDKTYTHADVKDYIIGVENSLGPGVTIDALVDHFPDNLIMGLIETKLLEPVCDTSGFHKYTWCKEKT